MDKARKNKKYELGRRLVKGPRFVGPADPASDKCAIGKGPPGGVKDQGTGSEGTQPRARKTAPSNNLNIVQININGLRNKKVELAKLLDTHHIHVALLQETEHKDADIHISGFTEYPCKCDDCRGIVTYIRNDIHGKVADISSAQPTDIQEATVWHHGKKFTILNIYNPPQNKYNTAHISKTEYHHTVLAGDFNGHSPLWGYKDHNPTGKKLEAITNATNLNIVQDSNSPPTLLHRAHKTLSRPDLTILSTDLLHKHTTQVLDDIGSDHRPILTTIEQPQGKRFQRKTKWNFKRAKWSQYKQSSDKLLSEIEIRPSDLDATCNEITSAILKAASDCIPRGHRRRYKPFWNKEMEQAVKLRKEARRAMESCPSLQNKISYNQTTAKVKKTIKAAKKEKWTRTCANLDLRKDGAKAWSLINNLNGESRKKNPKPLSTDTDTIHEEQKKAEAFNKYFSSVNKADSLSKQDRNRLQDLKHKERSPGANISPFEESFTMPELTKAMKKLKKFKSPGPDQIHNEMLLNLGIEGKKVILQLINATWETGKIPAAWKIATVIPLLKKGKPAEEMKSFRPIHLTSCLGKIAERMINTRLYWWLETNSLFNPNQAGFRAGHRTEDQLFRLSQRVIDGFQNSQSTTAVFVDLQQAYDRVWRKGLLWKMRTMGVHGKMYNWIKFFLTERLIQTKVNNGISSKTVQEEGLPQGSSLSCTLFLIFINDLPDVMQTENALYADDLVMWHSAKHVGISARRLNEDLERLQEYCDTWKLKINTSKTVYTVFTKSHVTAKKKPRLLLNGIELEKDETPTYLGVKLDRQLSLKTHTENLKSRANKRLLLVKRLGSTSWGASKDTLRQIYIGYVRSIMEYNLALQSISSKTTQKLLDKVQSQAVHFISGGMRSTPTAACEIDSNIQPLDLRREAAVMTMVERYKRGHETEPNKQLLDTWTPKQRLKQKSVLQVARELDEKHHLPDNREKIKLFHLEMPPQGSPCAANIKSNLVKELPTKKQEDPLTAHAIAERTIGAFPDDWIHIYTDGSAFKGTLNAGYGVKIQYPDGSKNELSDSCGANCSNYEAEAFAMEAAIHHLSTVFSTFQEKKANVVVFTDSKSVLEALDNGNLQNSAIQSLFMTINKFNSTFGVKLTLQWIPGHCNIAGNERADLLAKKGTAMEQFERPTSMHTAQQTLKNNIKEEWLNRWATGKTGRPVFRHMPAPNKKDNINTLERQDQVTIFRLRTHHAPLGAHLNHIQPAISPECHLCGGPSETTSHVLYNCPALQDIRERYLPKDPDPWNTLYTTPEQLKKTSTFYSIVLSRRAKAQVAAGSVK